MVLTRIRPPFSQKLGEGNMHVSNRINQSEQDPPKFPSLLDLIRIISKRDRNFPIMEDGKAVLSISFNGAGGPVRKVVRRSSYRQTYQLFSKKTMTTMSCESLIEFNACYIMETIPEIKSYQMQPAVITYLIDGEQHRHIPDALVEFNDQTSCFIEFKAESELGNEELISRTALMGTNLPAHGYGYLVVCDDQVKGIPLSNAKQLFHSQKTKIPQTTLMEIRNIFDLRKTVTIRNLLTTLAGIAHIKNHLYQLILTGAIGYDTDMLITPESEIYWKGNAK